jgi:hypothetical protein
MSAWFGPHVGDGVTQQRIEDNNGWTMWIGHKAQDGDATSQEDGHTGVLKLLERELRETRDEREMMWGGEEGPMSEPYKYVSFT